MGLLMIKESESKIVIQMKNVVFPKSILHVLHKVRRAHFPSGTLNFHCIALEIERPSPEYPKSKQARTKRNVNTKGHNYLLKRMNNLNRKK